MRRARNEARSTRLHRAAFAGLYSWRHSAGSARFIRTCSGNSNSIRLCRAKRHRKLFTETSHAGFRRGVGHEVRRWASLHRRLSPLRSRVRRGVLRIPRRRFSQGTATHDPGTRGTPASTFHEPCWLGGLEPVGTATLQAISNVRLRRASPRRVPLPTTTSWYTRAHPDGSRARIAANRLRYGRSYASAPGP